jgi:hypothetical protein
VAADEVSACGETMLLLLILVLLFLCLELSLVHPVYAVGLPNPVGGNRTGLSAAQDHDVARAAVHGHEVAPHLLGFLVVDCIRSALGRVDELREGLRVGRRRRKTSRPTGCLAGVGGLVGLGALGAFFVSF